MTFGNAIPTGGGTFGRLLPNASVTPVADILPETGAFGNGPLNATRDVRERYPDGTGYLWERALGVEVLGTTTEHQGEAVPRVPELIKIGGFLVCQHRLDNQENE